MNQNIFQIRKAFHDYVEVGQDKLLKGELTWEQFSFGCIGFETQLKALGDHLWEL